MPTYQYACTNTECGNRFELVQSFSDPSVTECPVCGQAVRKVYGSVGVVFKGSGFYRTDNRANTSSLSASESSSKSESSNSESSKSKSESSAAPKSEPASSTSSSTPSSAAS